jgi:hypothetical protein
MPDVMFITCRCRYFEKTCNNLVKTYLTTTSHTYGTGDSEVTQTRTTTHAKPAGVFWWVYNFNSGGPGGLVYFNPGVDQTKEGIAIKSGTRSITWCSSLA